MGFGECCGDLVPLSEHLAESEAWRAGGCEQVEGELEPAIDCGCGVSGSL
jgi:hypothetical protein